MINPECKGIRFVKHEGHRDCYDPVVFPTGLTEDGDSYIVDNGYHVYEIAKTTVASFSWYEICHNCGRELEADGMCGYCFVEDPS